MKLTTIENKDCANTPEFSVDYGDIEFQEPYIVPAGDNGAWYLSMSTTEGVMKYRRLCNDRSGNSHFGCPESGYPTGWSSRVSVINKQFGYAFVDASPYAVQVDTMLDLVQEQYEGDVFMSTRNNATDFQITVAPYLNNKQSSYEIEGCTSMVLHSKTPGFTAIAMHMLFGGEEMHVWPDGTVCYGSELLRHSDLSDDYQTYPAN